MTYSNELYHYGVVGMHWGVRKDRYDYYTKRAKKSQEKSDKARTRLGKYFHGDRAADFREMARTSKKMSEAKTRKERFWTKHGSKRWASENRSRAEKSDIRAKNSRLKIRRATNIARSTNLRTTATVWDATAKANGLGKKVATAVIKDATRDVETIGGRRIKHYQYIGEGVAANLLGFIPHVGPGMSNAGILYREFAGYRKNRKNV